MQCLWHFVHIPSYTSIERLYVQVQAKVCQFPIIKNSPASSFDLTSNAYLSGMTISRMSCLWTSLTFATRITRTNLLLQWTAWQNNRELPKVVVYRSSLAALVQTLILLIPLSAAVSLLVLNVQGAVYPDLTTISPTGLQFAAKILEILVQASIATIFLEFMRQAVLMSGRVPLGMLWSSMEIYNFSYLWSLELWGTLTATWLRKRRRILFGVCALACVVLMALVGPSGAILMIPRPITIVDNRSLLLLDDRASAFPLVANNVSTLSGLAKQSYRTLTDAIQAVNMQMIVDKQINTQFSPETAPAPRDLYIRNMSCDAGEPGCHMMASMPSSMISTLIGFYILPFVDQSTFQSLSLEVPQPVVSLDCFDNPWQAGVNTSETAISFGPRHKALDGIYTFSDILSHARGYTNSTNSHAFPNTVLYSPANNGKSYEYSLIFFTGVQDNTSLGRDSGTWKLSACVLDAAYGYGRLNFSRPSASIRVTNMDDMFANTTMWTNRMSRLRIEADLVATIDDILHDYIDSPDHRGLTAMSYWSRTQHLLVALSFTLSQIVSNLAANIDSTAQPQLDRINEHLEKQGLSKQYGNLNASTGSPDSLRLHTYTRGNFANASELEHLIIYATSDYIGYSTQGLPVKLALGVLGTYSALILTYIAYSLISGTAGSSWNTISELFFLALHSRKADHMTHTSVGARTLTSYREPVSILVGDDNAVQIVFVNSDLEKRGPYRPVVPNDAY